MIDEILTTTGTVALVYMAYNRYKTTKDLRLKIDQQNIKHENVLKETTKIYQEELRNLSNDHTIELASIKNAFIEEKQKFEKEIKWLHENFRNRGEILANNTLNEIKTNLIDQGIITSEQMTIFPNVIIPDSKGIRSRQIDHLILIPTGVYIVETKHWKGHTVLGFNKKTSGKFSFIDDLLGSHSKGNLVFTMDKNKLQVSSNYENPITQVQITSSRMTDYLKSRNIQTGWTTGIVYFNHENGSLHDWDKNTHVPRLQGPDQLKEYFQKELASKKWKLDTQNLESIKKEIQVDNYLSEPSFV